MELTPSPDPQKPTVVFARFWNFEAGTLYRKALEGRYTEIEWLPIENECIAKIKSAHGVPILSRAEMDERCNEVLGQLGLGRDEARAKLIELWGRNSRSALNDGEYENFLRRLEYMRDNPSTET